MPYEGERNEKRERHGEGQYHYEVNTFFTYKGEWKNGEKHGKGIFVLKDGSSYEGDFTEGEMTGQGIYRWPNGATYQGEFLLGEMHGEGIFVGADNETFAGQFAAGCLEGEGEAQFKNGDHYKGGFSKHLPHGIGQYTYHASLDDDENPTQYQGGFEHGKYHGEGTFINSVEGIAYEGDYNHGKRHGYGAYQLKDDTQHIVYEGDWEDDQPTEYPTHFVIREKENEPLTYQPTPYDGKGKPLSAKGATPITLQILGCHLLPLEDNEAIEVEDDDPKNKKKKKGGAPAERVQMWEKVGKEVGRPIAVDIYQLLNPDDYFGKKATKSWMVHESHEEELNDLITTIDIEGARLTDSGETPMVQIEFSTLPNPGTYCLVFRDGMQGTVHQLKPIMPYYAILNYAKK